jgi:hypothetical protein
LNESSYKASYPPEGYKIKNRRKLDRVSFDDLKLIAYQLSALGDSLFAADPPQVVKDGRMTETPISKLEFTTEMKKRKLLDEAEDAKKGVPPTPEERKAAVDAKNWVEVQRIDKAIKATKPTETNCEAYLRSLYKDPVYETRYHHLARIWDLLSVMKVIANTAWDTAVDANKRGDRNTGSKYEYIRELGSATARMLMRNVAADSPFVVRSELERIILTEFCTKIVKTLKEIAPTVPDFIPVSLLVGPAVGKAYWDAANLDRSDLKAPAAAAAAAAAAPGGGARTKGGVEFDAEIKAQIEAEQQEDIKLAAVREARRKEKFEQAKKDFGDEVTLDDIEISPSPPKRVSNKPSSHVIQGGKLTRRRRLPRLY